MSHWHIAALYSLTLRALCDSSISFVKTGLSADGLLSKWATSGALSKLLWYATPLRYLLRHISPT